MAKKKSGGTKTVETLTHEESKRKNIPTAEHRSVLQKEAAPRTLKYPRNTDLDPQLVWRGKDEQDWSELIVQAPPLYIQEKVHPKALIDDLLRESRESKYDAGEIMADLFADFNGIPKGVDKTEFYQHDQNWSNRMILGDSLQVMASLAEREGLRGKVQCIYIDPPYGIKFNSNFQWSTTSRDVKDGNAAHITREPEQVKAFRDTWRDGIHSYLTYLRDRLTVARDLLTESGSIFVQIGEENVHRVRGLMDEVFGDDNFVVEIFVKKKGSQKGELLENIADVILFYAKSKSAMKFRHQWLPRNVDDDATFSADLTGGGTFKTQIFPFTHLGATFRPSANNSWKTNAIGMRRIQIAERILSRGQIRYERRQSDFGNTVLTNIWEDTGGAADRIYVVQTAPKIIQRCILMATDAGDLVLDPTCGSGTTVYVAEQWGRRWITVDTSRVALALARARIMGARYPFYLLADSRDGQEKESEITRTAPSTKPVHGDIRHGFVYERVPHITLKSIANNAEIDVIHEKWQPTLTDALARLNTSLRKHKTPFRVTAGGRSGKDLKFDAAQDAAMTLPSGDVAKSYEMLEWEVPREAPADWPAAAKKPLADFWEARIARQKEIDASIAAKAEFEYLYDKPYEDKKKVRVAGPFTVESLSPHRMLGVDVDGDLIDPFKKIAEAGTTYGTARTFDQMILDNLKAAGVQQAHKEDRITFTALTPWPGDMVCAEGRYMEGDRERRAAIFIGPEFGTVSRPDLVEAAKEAGDAGFDVLIACAFNYEAHATEFEKLGRVPVLKARMNADLHMADELKTTGKGNLFVIFGEPDIDILNEDDGRLRVKVNGVDVFDPSTGEVRSDSAKDIACWFIDTNYNEESFFVRHAYFLGQNDPYGALKTTLKAEIDADAWESLHSDTSRPFDKPKTGRIAVKVINHLGDEVMKVFKA